MVKASTLLFKIENNMDQFSPAEKKVAMYIMENAEIVPNLTTKEVSTNADRVRRVLYVFVKQSVLEALKHLR